MERLPLASVRTFAVVARLLSITRAAQELNVTPSAVSHQIKALENYLEVRLFVRAKNGITLTPAGRQYMVQVSEGLLLLSRATRSIKGAKGRQNLRLAAPPSFAALWLVDRIGGFMKLFPEIAVSVTACRASGLFLENAFDAAFSYGEIAIPGMSADSLGRNRVFPVCKPSFIRGDHALRTPNDLARCTLLDSNDESYYDNRDARELGWPGWLQAAAAADFSPKRNLSFTPSVLMHRGVRAGLGVGLSRTLLAVDALASRELVVPFGPAVLQPTNYHLVFPAHLAKRKDIAAFRDWVLAEASTSVRKLERLLKPLTRTSTAESA